MEFPIEKLLQTSLSSSHILISSYHHILIEEFTDSSILCVARQFQLYIQLLQNIPGHLLFSFKLLQIIMDKPYQSIN